MSTQATWVASEEAPEHDLSLLREAVENVDQVIVIIDSAMRVCLVNAKARAMWRLRDEHCAGRPPFAELSTISPPVVLTTFLPMSSPATCYAALKPWIAVTARPSIFARATAA